MTKTNDMFMSTNSWIPFRTGLFQTMEDRRAKAALFRCEQIYWFIIRCSKLCSAPGTTEAQDALKQIQDEGTFLLVADSLSEFQAMFQPAKTSEEPKEQVEPQPACENTATDTKTMQNPPLPPPASLRAGRQQVQQQRPQPVSSARQSSGRSF